MVGLEELDSTVIWKASLEVQLFLTQSPKTTEKLTKYFYWLVLDQNMEFTLSVFSLNWSSLWESKKLIVWRLWTLEEAPTHMSKSTSCLTSSKPVRLKCSDTLWSQSSMNSSTSRWPALFKISFNFNFVRAVNHWKGMILSCNDRKHPFIYFLMLIWVQVRF